MIKCKLGEIADFKTGPFGTQFSSSEYTSTGIPMINIENISNGRLVEEKLQYISKETQKRLSVHAVKEGDIIFGRAGSVDRHLYIFDEYEGYVQGSNCIRMRPTIKVNSRYLSYYLLLPSVKKQIINQSAGSVQAFLNTDKLKSINIVIQDNADKIAKFLDSIESKIFVNNKTICTLESLSKILYDYYFLQFDFPNEKGRPYKSSGGKMEYNAELGREIPAGWKVNAIADIESQIITGKTPSTSHAEYYNGDIPFITIGDIRNHIFVTNTEITLTSQGANSQPNKYLPPNSLCVSCIASPGQIGFTTELSQTNQQINSIIISNPQNKVYLFYALKDYFSSNAATKTGNTFSNMSKGDFSAIKVINPSQNVLEKFHTQTQSHFLLIRKAELENRHLASLRDFLLPLLMNGQVGFKK